MSIIANYEEMYTCAKNIVEAADEYIKNVEDLYKIVDDLNNAWKSSASLTYQKAVNQYKDDMKKLGLAVGGYGKFLGEAINIHKNTDDDIASNAGRL